MKSLNGRLAKIEREAAPQIQNAIDELQRQREEKAQRERERTHKAYRWRNFGEWCYQNRPDLNKKAYAARTSIPEEPLDPTLKCNGGKISCDECGGCQMPIWDEDIDIDKLSPEHRANWLEYLQLFFSISDDELDKAENIWMAELVGTTPDDPQLSEKIAAAQARMVAESEIYDRTCGKCDHPDLDHCDGCEHQGEPLS